LIWAVSLLTYGTYLSSSNFISPVPNSFTVCPDLVQFDLPAPEQSFTWLGGVDELHFGAFRKEQAITKFD